MTYFDPTFKRPEFNPMPSSNLPIPIEPPLSDSAFALYVRRRAHELSINLSEIARKTGISRQALYNLMSGKSEQAKISTVLALSHVLQIHPLALFRLLLIMPPKLPNTEAKYKWNATGFVRDVTIPDNTLVLARQVFFKQWEIQNAGFAAWINRRLMCVDSPPQTFGELSNDSRREAIAC
jgi:transcriptional regulator with XRE-family HTH domain